MKEGGIEEKKTAYVGKTVAIWGNERTIGKALHSVMWNINTLFIYIIQIAFEKNILQTKYMYFVKLIKIKIKKYKYFLQATKNIFALLL